MTIKIKDADGVARELAANGDGSAGNPFQPVHLAPVADGDDVCQGSIADVSVAAGAAGTLSAKLRKISADLGTVLTFVDGLEGLLAGGLPLALTASGGLKVGHVEPIPAGTNNIGDVDVLTLPAGTVAGAASLPGGTNNIGDVDVLTLPALPAGGNVVGKVGIDQTTPGTTNRVYLTDINAGKYETVAASQTDQVLGATGAAGNYLAGVLIVPATTSPGAVSIKDGAGSAIVVFTGGASSVSNLVPFFVPLGIVSTGGAWKITTGASVSAIGIGNFS